MTSSPKICTVPGAPKSQQKEDGGVINCAWVVRTLRYWHHSPGHRRIHWHIGHSHGHVFAGIAGTVGAATGVIVCTEIGPGLWSTPPYLGRPYGGPGLGPGGLSGAPVPVIGGRGLCPEELSVAPVPFIGGPGFPVGIVGGELAAPSISSVGNGSGTSEINQIGNRGSLPRSISIRSTPGVAVIGQVPEPSSALILIAAVLAMALLRSPSRGRGCWPRLP